MLTDIKALGLGQVLLLLFAVAFLTVSLFKERFEGLVQKFSRKSALILVISLVILAFMLISYYVIFQDLVFLVKQPRLPLIERHHIFLKELRVHCFAGYVVGSIHDLRWRLRYDSLTFITLLL